MTANDIIREATALLGYSDNDGNSQLTQRVRNRALPLFNLVYNDLRQVCELKHKPVISLSEKIVSISIIVIYIARIIIIFS